VLLRKGYAETDIRISLGIRFGGLRGGMTELLSKSPTQQVYDLNQEPLSPSELQDHLSGMISPIEGNAMQTFLYGLCE
jgi:hypothetical protein